MIIANFIKFLNKIRVPTMPAQMTFGLSRDHGVFEWARSSPDSIFCQRRHLLSPKMWRTIFDVIRFNQFSLDLLIEDGAEGVSPSLVNGNGDYLHKWQPPKAEDTIAEYLSREGYSDAFRDNYLIPMAMAVWDTTSAKCILELPAVTLVRSLWKHGLLSAIDTGSAWLAIQEGSRAYIDAVMKGFPPNHLFLNTPVSAVTNEREGRVRVHLQDGRTRLYDHVILATPSDEAYQIIKYSATPEEEAIMKKFHICRNTAILHSDIAHMPASPKAWSSCNSLALTSPSAGKSRIEQMSLTYNMNMLQHIPRQTFGDILVTLNPLRSPDPKLVQGRFEYAHLIRNMETERAQAMLPKIQNRRGISYAGAWTRYGTPEDGLSSGLTVAKEHLDARLPFEIVDSTYDRGTAPVLGLADHLARLIILIVLVFFVVPLERIADRLSASKRRTVNMIKSSLMKEKGQ